MSAAEIAERKQTKAKLQIELLAIDAAELIEDLVEKNSWYRTNMCKDEDPNGDAFWQRVPRYMESCLNKPPGMSEQDFKTMIESKIIRYRSK